MAITTPFSLQNSTLTVYPNSTTAQKNAMSALNTAIDAALANTDSVAGQAALKTAYTNYFASCETQSPVFTITTAAAGTFTTISDVDGTAAGTWFGTGSAAGASGTFISTNITSATAAVLRLDIQTLGSLTGTTALTQANVSLIFNKGTSTASPVITAATGSLVVGAGTGKLVGFITDSGETGETRSLVTADLINTPKKYKATGTVDSGSMTFTYLNVPSDPGQAELTLASKDGVAATQNRVFKITHTLSGVDDANSQKWYGIGLVKEIKTPRGKKDAMSDKKVSIELQSGDIEVNPA